MTARKQRSKVYYIERRNGPAAHNRRETNHDPDYVLCIAQRSQYFWSEDLNEAMTFARDRVAIGGVNITVTDENGIEYYNGDDEE